MSFSFLLLLLFTPHCLLLVFFDSMSLILDRVPGEIGEEQEMTLCIIGSLSHEVVRRCRHSSYRVF